MDDAEIQINDIQHREVKATNQNKKKKESKKAGMVETASATTSRGPTCTSEGSQKKRKSKKLEIYLKK